MALMFSCAPGKSGLRGRRPRSVLFATLAPLALSALFVLSGCAGSRGSPAEMDAGSGAGMDSVPPDWLLDASAVREAVPGSSPYGLTPEELAALDERIVTGADTETRIGHYRAFDGFPGYAHGAECAGGVCRYGGDGESRLEDHFFGLEYQPVMERGGLRFGQVFFRVTDRVVPDPERFQDVTGYGAWMDHGAFFLQVSFYPDREAPDSVLGLPYTVGRASGSNPSAGSATWTGAAVATDLNGLFPDPGLLQGDAGIVWDLGGSTVDVTLEGFVDLRTGAATGHRMEWTGVAVRAGSFSEGTHWDGGQVAGAFYGDGHEEVGGVFRSGSMAGSFGASRSNPR